MDSLTNEALEALESKITQKSLAKIRPVIQESENHELRELFEDGVKVGRLRERMENI